MSWYNVNVWLFTTWLELKRVNSFKLKKKAFLLAETKTNGIPVKLSRLWMTLLVKAAVCFVHTICCCGLQRKKRGRRSVGNAVDLRHATFCLFFRWGVKFPNFTEKNSHQWYHARIEQKNTQGAVRRTVWRRRRVWRGVRCSFHVHWRKRVTMHPSPSTHSVSQTEHSDLEFRNSFCNSSRILE